jgi:hypothetical protein
MCCEGFHDARAKLDVPGHVRFVTICAVCGREQRELTRQAYSPDPRLGAVHAGEDPAVVAVRAVAA